MSLWWWWFGAGQDEEGMLGTVLQPKRDQMLQNPGVDMGEWMIE